MGTNYSRRLGGTDKFLKTTIKGKRIEVKSDILTEKYNSKIMKNLKKMIDEFHTEARAKIINGEFEVVSTEDCYSYGYIGNITIRMDDVDFRFSLGETVLISDHSRVAIYPYDISESELNMLKNAYFDFTKAHRDSRIKELQDKIEELKKLS